MLPIECIPSNPNKTGQAPASQPILKPSYRPELRRIDRGLADFRVLESDHSDPLIDRNQPNDLTAGAMFQQQIDGAIITLLDIPNPADAREQGLTFYEPIVLYLDAKQAARF